MSALRMSLLFGAFCAVSAFQASALEVGEVMNMLNSGVQESVVINMVEQQKLSRPLTAREVIDLSCAGASPTLMEALTNVANVYPNVVSTPSVSYATTSPAPIIVETPATIVTTPPPVYYTYPNTYHYNPYRYRYRPGLSFGFHFGSRRGRPHRPPPFRGPGRPGRRPRPGGRPPFFLPR